MKLALTECASSATRTKSHLSITYLEGRTRWVESTRSPIWSELASNSQRDLARKGFDEYWFAGSDEEVRLGVLNIYVKLRSITIAGTIGWKFISDRTVGTGNRIIGGHTFVDQGSLMFSTLPANLLRNSLFREPTFADPFAWRKGWDSRELCPSASIHFKHANDWDLNMISVHIDPAGLAPSPGVWGKISPRQWKRHLEDYLDDGWKNVSLIRSILVKQGWDRTCLTAGLTVI